MKFAEKFLAGALAFLMCLSILPVPAQAENIPEAEEALLSPEEVEEVPEITVQPEPAEPEASPEPQELSPEGEAPAEESESSGPAITICRAQEEAEISPSALVGDPGGNPPHDYSVPVPRFPNDPIDINQYDLFADIHNMQKDENGNYIYTGGEYFAEFMMLEPDGYGSNYVLPDNDLSIELIGDNIRPELNREGYQELTNIIGGGAYGWQDRFDNNSYMLSTLTSFYKFSRRLGLSRVNEEVLLLISLGLDDYTLDELRQYSCAREFVDRTGYWCIDEVFEHDIGYTSFLEDTVLEYADRAGLSKDEYLEKLVRDGEYAGYDVETRYSYPGYYVISCDAITRQQAEDFCKQKNMSLFMKDGKYYLRFLTTSDYQHYVYSNAMQSRPGYAAALGISEEQMEILYEAEARESYYAYYNFTYRDAVNAWADEMDTWWGHWDYFLYGDEHFDYWYESESKAKPGYYDSGHWAEGFPIVVDQYVIEYDPTYVYYITGPGEFEVIFRGKNNQDGHGRSNFTGEVRRSFTVVDPENPQPVSGWIFDGQGWKYYYPGGSMASNAWLVLDGSKFYCGSDGYMLTGWQIIYDNYYCFNESGVMLTGWQYIDGAYYYLGDDGIMQTGEQLIDGSWFYLYPDGHMASDEVIGDYYYDASGYRQESPDGKLVGEAPEMGYQYPDGSWAYEEWKQVCGKYYYFNMYGCAEVGWYQSGDTWYYFDEQSCTMQTGWVLLNGAYYYFDAGGAMLTGRQEINGSVYYFYENDPYYPDGVMATDVWIGDEFYSPGGNMYTDCWMGEAPYWWYQLRDGTYYHDCFKTIDGWTYYFQSNGYITVYWMEIDGYWYYFDYDGHMYKNMTVDIDGSSYTFDSQGHLI